MKKVIFLLFISILFYSCKYGINEAFWRPDQVNSRTKEIKELPLISADISGKYSVLVLTDIHFGQKKESVENKTVSSFESWFNLKKTELSAQGYPVEFAAVLGDCVESGVESEYAKYRDFCTRFETAHGIKIYAVPGNHDLYNSGWSNFVRYTQPALGAFRFETETAGSRLSWYFLDTACGTLGNEQFEDLKAKMSVDSNPKIVFTHFPVYARDFMYFTLQNQEERDSLMMLFAKSGVKKLVTGHYHPGQYYEIPGYFDEHVQQSFAAYKKCSIVYADHVNHTYRVEEFKFLN